MTPTPQPAKPLRERLLAAADYSGNHATAKPDIAPTEREHILGLVALLREAAEAVAVDGWRDIASAPKTRAELFVIGEDSIRTSVLIGRAPQHTSPGAFIAGAVAECTLDADGRWVYPAPPVVKEWLNQEWSELAEPTHWQPLPAAPSPAISEESK